MSYNQQGQQQQQQQPAITTRHFTEALVVAHSVETALSTPLLRSQAEQYLLQLQQSSVGLELAMYILSSETPDNYRTFWACQTLSAHFQNMTPNLMGANNNNNNNNNAAAAAAAPTGIVDAGNGYQVMITWLRRVIGMHEQALSCLNAGAPIPYQQPAEWVIKKHTHTFVIGLLYFFPDRWTNYFEDLFSLVAPAPGSASPITLDVLALNYFLRSLQYIDEVIVEPGELLRSQPLYRQRSMLIKDAMREVAVRRAVEVWYAVLSQFHSTAVPPQQVNVGGDASRAAGGGGAPSTVADSSFLLCQLVLNNIQRYVDWIDINLILDERWVNLLYFFMARPVLRIFACECFGQVIQKKQLPMMKLQTIAALRLVYILPKLIPVVAETFPTNTEAVNFHLVCCRFIVGAAGEILSCVEAMAEIINGQVNGYDATGNGRASGGGSAAHWAATGLPASAFAAPLPLPSGMPGGMTSATAIAATKTGGFSSMEQLQQYQQLAEAHLHDLLPHIIKLLCVPLYLTREIVTPFLHSYIKSALLTEAEAGALVVAIFQQTCVEPKGCVGMDATLMGGVLGGGGGGEDVNQEDEDPAQREARLVDQRRFLHNLLRLLHRKYPKMILDHVVSVVQIIVSATAAATGSGGGDSAAAAQVLTSENVEGVLRYVFEMGEALRFDSQRVQNNPECQQIAQLIGMILNSNLSYHGSPQVHIALFELYDRYYAFFVAYRDQVPKLLTQFLSQQGQGTRHTNPKVRARVCYLFSHTVSTLKKEYAMYGEDIAKSVVDILTKDGAMRGAAGGGFGTGTPASSNAQAGLMTSKEKCDLFEALGVLLGSAGNFALCGQVSQQVVLELNGIVDASAGGVPNAPTATGCITNEFVAQQIADCISYLASLIKGVGGIEATRMPDSPNLTGNNTSTMAGLFPPSNMSLPPSSSANAVDGANAAGGNQMNAGMTAAQQTQAALAQQHPVFHAVTQRVLRAAIAAVYFMSVREKLLEYMQQIINVLGVESLSYIETVVVGFLQHAPSGGLTGGGSGGGSAGASGGANNAGAATTSTLVLMELPKLMRLVSQAVSKTRSSSVQLVGGILLPAMLTKLLLVGSPAELQLVHNVVSESTRELTEVYRAFFGLVHAVTHSTSCISCMSSPEMQPHLTTLLGKILLAALRVPVDSELPKMSIQILTRLSLYWADNRYPSNAMTAFVLDNLLPEVLDVLTSTPSLINCSDARGFLVMGEVMTLLRAAIQKCGAELVGGKLSSILCGTGTPATVMLISSQELQDFFGRMMQGLDMTGSGQSTDPSLLPNLRTAFRAFVDLVQSRRQAQQQQQQQQNAMTQGGVWTS